MVDSDYIFESGEAVDVGNPVENNYVKEADGNISDGDESKLAFISSRGFGVGIQTVVRYDASKGETLLNGSEIANDGERITDWLDYEGDADLTSFIGPIRTDNYTNGETVVDFKGQGNALSFSISSSELQIGEPFSIIAVPASIYSRDIYTEYIIDEEIDSTNNITLRYRNASKDYAFSTNSGDVLTGNFAPEMPLLLTGVCDGSDSVLRENGSQVDSGTLSGDIDGIVVGNNKDEDRGMGKLAEIRIYSENIVSSGKVDQIESDVASTWGLSI